MHLIRKRDILKNEYNNRYQNAPTISNIIDSRLVQLHKNLTPSADEAVEIASLVQSVRNLTEKISNVQPIQEVKIVGPYAKGIMMPNENSLAELVILLSEPPTKQRNQSLFFYISRYN